MSVVWLYLYTIHTDSEHDYSCSMSSVVWLFISWTTRIIQDITNHTIYNRKLNISYTLALAPIINLWKTFNANGIKVYPGTHTTKCAPQISILHSPWIVQCFKARPDDFIGFICSWPCGFDLWNPSIKGEVTAITTFPFLGWELNNVKLPLHSLGEIHVFVQTLTDSRNISECYLWNGIHWIG